MKRIDTTIKCANDMYAQALEAILDKGFDEVAKLVDIDITRKGEYPHLEEYFKTHEKVGALTSYYEFDPHKVCANCGFYKKVKGKNACTMEDLSTVNVQETTCGYWYEEV